MVSLLTYKCHVPTKLDKWGVVQDFGVVKDDHNFEFKKKMCACFVFFLKIWFLEKKKLDFFWKFIFFHCKFNFICFFRKNLPTFWYKKTEKKTLVVRCEVHLQTSQQWQLKAKTTSPWQHCYNIHCCGVGWFFVFFQKLRASAFFW